MNKLLPILLFICMSILTSAQIVINEISYNPPESNIDSLEYIELYNAGSTGVDLSGYSFSGIEFTFAEGEMIDPDAYRIVCVNASAMMSIFGVEAVEWQSGGLKNGGEAITLRDNSGTLVDTLFYLDSAPWPTEADGTDSAGGSIELCDPLSDNTDGASWRVATNDIGVMLNGKSVLGTPGAANTASCEVQPDYIVNSSGLSFTPADITIQVGETVRWENTGGSHNVNGSTDVYPNNPVGFLSGTPNASNWTFDFTFDVPGFYNYQCDPHVNLGMVGTITVEGEVVPPMPLVITEIMYNDPGAEDSIEYIELYNAGTESINLEGLAFSQGITHSFVAQDLAAGEYLVLSKFPDMIMNRFGIESIAWEDGGLSNGGELLEIVNDSGVIIDAVTYDDNGDWSEDADGLGYSLTLCDIEGDNNDPANWAVCAYTSNTNLNGVTIFAHPGKKDRCKYSIAEITDLDADQAITFEGEALISGTVYGINFRPGGLQFTLIDEANDGVSIFNLNNDLGYTVNEGDILNVEGVVTQFNGLAQLNIDGITQSGVTTIQEATVVNTLSEDTESQLVKIEGVHIVDPVEWTGLNSGFNVRVTTGNTDTITVRIDADVDLYSKGYPQGTFDVTGLGGQYDDSAPYTEGYQLFPRYTADISPFNEFVEVFPEYSIPTVTSVDSEGITDSLGRKVTLRGIAHGINFRPSGLLFWLIDQDNNGILVFNLEDNVGYTVAEGDNLTIKGTIDQFNGLTEIIPAEIAVESSGNDLVTPLDFSNVGALNESHESSYVASDDGFTLVDASMWTGDGSSFTVDMTNGTTTVAVNIDADTPFASMINPPGLEMSIRGLVSQSDTTEPFDSGYSIWVRYESDLTVVNDVVNVDESDLINVYPNPVSGLLNIETDLNIQKIEILDITAKRIKNISTLDNRVDVSDIRAGTYFVKIYTTNDQYIHRFIKM